MKRNFFYILTFASAISFASCSNDGGKGTDGTDTTKTEGSAGNEASSSKGKYSIKSGIVTYDMETMGMQMPTTIYFDDYGNKECTETIAEIEMAGITTKTHQVVINKDGYTYTLDLMNKTGTKMKVPAGMSDPKNMDFSKMTEAMLEQMHIKKQGSETVCGKTCDVYVMDYADMSMKGKFAIWNNILLQNNTSIGEMVVNMNATKLEENASVPADKFEIPADIQITEL